MPNRKITPKLKLSQAAMIQKTANTEPPPAYNTLLPDDRTVDEIERVWARAEKDTKMCRCGKRCTRNNCTKYCQTWLGFQSDAPQPGNRLTRLFFKTQRQPKWRAIVCVSSRNVAGLMRHGLSWSSKDLRPGHNWIFLHATQSQRTHLPSHCKVTQVREMLTRQFAPSWGKAKDVSWPHYRVLHFSSPSATPAREGNVFVFSHEPSVVINFDIESITSNSNVWGWAMSTHGDPVFDTRGGPNEAFNAIFSGLLRWWTCPGDGEVSKAEGQQAAQRKADTEDKTA